MKKVTYLKNNLLPKNWYWFIPVLPACIFFINRVIFSKNQIFSLIFWEFITITFAVCLSELSPFREISTHRTLENFIEYNGFFKKLASSDKIIHSIYIKWFYSDQFLILEVSHIGVYYSNFNNIPFLLANLFQFHLFELNELPNGNLYIVLLNENDEPYDATKRWKKYE